jgi:hypothetical protein
VTKPLAAGAYTVIVTVETDGRKLEGHWRFNVNAQVHPPLAQGR